MHRLTLAIAAACLALIPAMPAAAQPPPAPAIGVAEHPSLGPILADDQGVTLYRFTRDGPDVSNCYDQCAQTWPPLLVAEDGEPVPGPELGGTLGVITRRDNARQVTYNGMPLYYYARDASPGDANGQGVPGVWFVVEPVSP
jgi:predicted lipoprotein with Yx(FWY)xxD motif